MSKPGDKQGSNPMHYTEDGLIPDVGEEEYQLVFVSHYTMVFHRLPRVIVWFRIVTEGEHFEKVIPRYWNVDRLIGRVGKGGKFAFSRSQDGLREFCSLFPNWIPDRLDRIPMSMFKGHIFLGKTKWVKTDHRQKEMPKQLIRSKVEYIAEIVD